MSKKNRLLPKIFAGIGSFLLAILFVGESSETIYAKTEQKIIKVGYIDCGRFIELLDNGDYYGYCVDYLEKIGEYTGWEYRYIYGTWEECLAKVEAGELDFVCMAEYNEERAERFIYANQPLGYEYTALYVRDDSDIYYEDYQAMDGCRVGVLGQSIYVDKLENIEKEHGVDFTPVKFYTATGIENALANGSVDLAILGSVFGDSEAKIVGKFDAKPYYCITGKGNAELMEEFNEAIAQVKLEEPGFEANLFQKYYENSKISSRPMYTREEQEYIDTAEPIVVKLMMDTRPLSYVEDGKETGIFVEYLNLLSEKSGLQFQIEETTSKTLNEETEQILEKDYITLRSKRVLEDIGLDKRLITSKPLIETKLAYVEHRDDLATTAKEHYVIAITNEMTYLPLISRRNINHEIKYYNDVQECFDAVLDGEADVAIQDSYLVNYWLQKPKYAEALVECRGDEVTNSMCLIASEDDRMLIQIIDKTIEYISEEEKEEIFTMQLLMNPYYKDVKDILYEYWEWIACIAFILVMTAIVYAIMMRRMAKLQIKKKEYEILQKKVQRDELTGVYNRKYFCEKAGEVIGSTEDAMCIVTMDISNFKIVNDLYGMERGDQLLKHIAQEMKKLGEGKPFILARFNADHFYMCLREQDFKEMQFPRRFKNTPIENMDIKVSYGVFEIGEHKDLPVNIMCDRAAMAVHNKERKQTEYIRYYAEEERSRIVREQEIESEMEEALESRQFCAYVQPKYDIDSGKIIGGEALVRWIHPEKGMVSPGEFIPVFEKNGFILYLDYYVWEETCKFLAKMRKQGIVRPISINVSRAHFYTKELINKLEELVAKYGIEPADLELEITESIYADDTDSIYKQIGKLQNAGFKIAMDDFGSGYSSLNMLKEIPLDILKMDLKFLDSKENVEKSYKILQTLVTLAKNLELSVVVEGVETKEQVEFLKGIGGLYAQGYFYSKPVDMTTYENLLLQ